jgi:hypothetical protein
MVGLYTFYLLKLIFDTLNSFAIEINKVIKLCLLVIRIGILLYPENIKNIYKNRVRSITIPLASLSPFLFEMGQVSNLTK